MNGLVRKMIPAFICVSLGLGATAAFAKGECKGSSKSVCSADKSCSWVKGYVKKDGKKVTAYCRVKSGKKKASAKKPDTKSTSKKAEKVNKQVKEKTKSTKP